jgi:hypothetical protein
MKSMTIAIRSLMKSSAYWMRAPLAGASAPEKAKIGATPMMTVPSFAVWKPATPRKQNHVMPWTMIATASSTRGIPMAAQNANPGDRVGVDPVLSPVSRVVSSVSLRQPVSMKSAMASMMTATSISMKYRVSVSAAQQA